jgi:cell division protein ZapA (FtsZ GTPase activity inhibitor)
MTRRDPKTTTVEIFGASYNLRSDKESEYLQELAETVNQRMAEAAKLSGSGDSGRVAILAALNLADELFQSRERLEEDRGGVQERLAKLTADLEAALGS